MCVLYLREVQPLIFSFLGGFAPMRGDQQILLWNYGDRNVLYIMIITRIAYKNQEINGDCYEKARYDLLL